MSDFTSASPLSQTEKKDLPLTGKQEIEHKELKEGGGVQPRDFKQKGKEILEPESIGLVEESPLPGQLGKLQGLTSLLGPLKENPPAEGQLEASGNKRKGSELQGEAQPQPPKKKFVLDPTIAMLIKMLPDKPKLVEKTPEEKARDLAADKEEELKWPECEVKLSAENGTNGSLVHMIFISPKFTTPPTGSKKVLFVCKERDFEVQQDGIWVEDSKLQITFAISQRLSKERVVSFSIRVRGIRHNEVKYLWVNPATFGAATFLKKEGFPTILEEKKRDDLAEKLAKMTNKTRNSIVSSYGVLGQVESIKILKDVYGVNICGVSPITGENLLHVGLRENWPELASYAATFPEFFWQPDILGVTPHQLLEWLSNRHPSKALLSQCPEKPEESDD